MAGNLSEAEERAYNLLLQHLTPAQQKTFKQQGYFEFTSRGKTKWRCYTEESLMVRGSSYYTARLVRWEKIGDYVHAYNVWAASSRNASARYDSVPECDTLLALKAVVEATGKIPVGCESSHRYYILDVGLKAGALLKYPS